jgi:hypothetical protein
LLAGSAGPDGGVNAVEITEAVQVVTPPRWSVTVTPPSRPLIVLELVEATCDPSETVPVGALIESPPAVSEKVAVVAAPAGRAAAAAKQATRPASSKDFVAIAVTFPFRDENGGRTQFIIHPIGIQLLPLKSQNIEPIEASLRNLAAGASEKALGGFHGSHA